MAVPSGLGPAAGARVERRRKQDDHPLGVSRARGAFAVAVGFIILLAAALWLYAAVSEATKEQRASSDAQRARARAFVAMLDAETSVRGFTETGLITFLEPYAEAQATISECFAELHLRLQAIGAPALLPLADDEVQLYARWHDTVAVPLLADHRRQDATAIALHGKALIDRFRSDNGRLDAGIGQAVDLAQERVTTALFRITIVAAVFGAVFLFGYLLFDRQRSRMVAENLQARLLYENERRIADTLQRAFVQKALPIVPDVGFHASYVPAEADARVGGDWYDAFVLPDGRILFSIGDVAGHGLDAAVIMSRARQAIISNGLHERDPGVVLQRANEALLLQDPQMVTAVCGYIDTDELRITYATAGHPPPVLAESPDQARFLPHEGIPLGILPNVAYGSFIEYAVPGSLLLLYTDGVLEHKRDILDGERRLLDAARGTVGTAGDPAALVRHTIFGDQAPIDDVAIMTVSFAVRDDARTATLSAVSLNRLTTGDR